MRKRLIRDTFLYFASIAGLSWLIGRSIMEDGIAKANFGIFVLVVVTFLLLLSVQIDMEEYMRKNI